MNTPLVNVRDLEFGFADSATPIFRGLNLDIADGEFVALVGGSGVGKSTLLRNIAGLIPANGGHIRLTPAQDPGSRDTAFVFQDTRLLPWRRIRANVGYGLTGLDVSATERNNRIEQMLELTAMSAYGDRWPHAVSGGQAQRIGLARALAVRPRLLLMDEPFSAVDALTRGRLQDQLVDIWRQLGMAVLFVTHDIEEAVYLADRVCVMSGAPADFARTEHVSIERPRDRTHADFQAICRRIADAL